jgi:hypothetical protein
MNFSVDNVVTKILSDPKPIIFWDTCSLLDIIRVPFRENIQSDILSSSVKILEKIENGQLFSIVNYFVELEYNDHESHTYEEAKNHLIKIHKNISKIKDLVTFLPGLPNLDNLDLIGLNLENSLKDISRKILNNCLIIDEDTECTSRASNRIYNNYAPASKGKREFKDCSIIEHYLKISKCLRDNSFDKKIVFVTSNTDDYGSPPIRIKEPLNIQFPAVNLEFYSTLHWAYSQLNIS